MTVQTKLSIEWEGSLVDDEAHALAFDLKSAIPEGSVEIQTEKALGGMELVISTIVIAMATKVGEKIVEALSSGIKSLRKAGVSKDCKNVTLNVTWDGGQTKIVLPLNNEDELKSRLNALGELIATS